MEPWSSTWRGSEAGKATVVVDEDPLADGHFILMLEIASRVRQGET